MNKQSFTLDRLESLLTGLSRTPSKYQLRLEAPLLGNLPEVLNLLVDDGIVVLQVTPETLGFEASPECELVHGRGMFRPLEEHVRVDRELLLEGMDSVGVFKEEDLQLAS